MLAKQVSFINTIMPLLHSREQQSAVSGIQESMHSKWAKDVTL